MTTVAFYVQAGARTGYGHIVRCLALADVLKERGAEPWFLTNCEAVKCINEAGYPLAVGEEPGRADVWIVDLEGGCPPGLAAGLRELCDTLVILNGVGYPDGDPGRLLADLVFYQGVTRRPHFLDWTGFKGEWFEGSDWLILRRECAGAERRSNSPHHPARVLVAGGGSDPKDITSLVMRALRSTDYQIKAIIGPANPRAYSCNPRTTALYLDPPDVIGLMRWADVALVSYGMTAFECLAVGTPVVALSISDDHADSARLVETASDGALLNLGIVEGASPLHVRTAILSQLSSKQYQVRSEKAAIFVDSFGAWRVADKIMEKIMEKVKDANA